MSTLGYWQIIAVVIFTLLMVWLVHNWMTNPDKVRGMWARVKAFFHRGNAA